MRQLSRISLRDILYILFRDKLRIFLIAAVALSGAGIYLMFEDNIYVADTRVLVRVGKEKLAGLEAYAKDSYNILFQERGQDIHNGLEILKDERLAIAVVERLRPTFVPPPPAETLWKKIKHQVKAVIKTLKDWSKEPLYWLGFKHRLSEEEQLLRIVRGSLGVEAIEDTDVIQISFGWPDPEFAALAVNTFADEFISEYVRVHQNATTEPFYREQIAHYEAVLEEAEKALSDFRVNTNVANITLEKELLLKSIAETEAQLWEVELRLEENQTLKKDVVRTLRRTSDWVQTPGFSGAISTDLSELDKRYLELVAKRVELSTTHTVLSPQVQKIDKRIEELRQQKAKNLTAYYSLNILSRTQERDVLKTRLAEKQDRLHLLTRETGKLGELERQRKIAEGNYLTYRDKAEELRISDELTNRRVSGLRIVNEAVPPATPMYPRRSLIVGLAGLFGLFLGIGYSAVREYFNQTFRESEDVERILGARLLMTVPKV